jgi:hypothetical protein
MFWVPAEIVTGCFEALAAVRVSGRGLSKPGLPRSLLSSTIVILSKALETKVADLLCQLLTIL